MTTTQPTAPRGRQSDRRLTWAATTLRDRGYRQIANRLAVDVGFTEPEVTPIADSLRDHRRRSLS